MEHYNRKVIQSKIKAAFGSQAHLARLLGDISSMGVSLWFHEDRNGIPLEYCPRIAELSAGRLTEHDLRPDFFPAPSGDQRGAA